MRIYESTFILSPQSDDAAFDRQIKAILDLIARNQGNVLHEDRWGIRRLAYPIKKFTQGFYTRIVFEGTNEILQAMERHFHLEEPYIRYLTVAYEGKIDENWTGAKTKVAAEPAPEPSVAPVADKAPSTGESPAAGETAEPTPAVASPEPVAGEPASAPDSAGDETKSE